VELVIEPDPIPAAVPVARNRMDRDDDDGDDEPDDLVEVGSFPRLQAQILRRRLETA
jgi:hypothetical protein